MLKSFTLNRLFICLLLVSVGLSVSISSVFAQTAKTADSTKHMSLKEKQAAAKQRTEERKRLQKEKLAVLKQKRIEKERARKEALKEKKRQQKAMVKLKKDNLKTPKKSIDKDKALAKKETPDNKMANAPQGKNNPQENRNAINDNDKTLAKTNENTSTTNETTKKVKTQKADKQATAKTKGNAAPKPKEKAKDKVKKVAQATMPAPAKDSTTKATDNTKKIAKKEASQKVGRNKERTLAYDFPKKTLLNDGFVKYGKLYSFHVRGINRQLYDVMINDVNYTQDMDFDSSLPTGYKLIKALPIALHKSDISTSLMKNAPWLDFFARAGYKSTATPVTYKNYIKNFNDIKVELKKEALSYKDFVGVLQTSPARDLPMQYELLDTTFYKSYYLLFVSRVDLLKDYHNAFINQVAALDTVRYRDVENYLSRTKQALENFINAKRKIEKALDTLSYYARAMDEYYELFFTDPVAYTSEEIATLKEKFFATFSIPKEADTAGILGVSNAIRAKFFTLKKQVQDNLSRSMAEEKKLNTYLLQSRDYADMYLRKHAEIASALERMNTFVDKELSLEGRNIRLSEIVENLYKRLMLEYEHMRNDVKDNMENMQMKVRAYNDFLATDFTQTKLQADLKKIKEDTRLYADDSVYTRFSSLLSKTYAYVADTSNFDVASNVRRVHDKDFVDYKVVIKPKKNLPPNVSHKYGILDQNFRFPVYGGFQHTMSLGLGANLSFRRQYNLTPVANNTTGEYTITQDGKLTKAKFHLAMMYHFFYRGKNPNWRIGGAAGLLLDLTNLTQLQNTKVLLGPSLLIYNRLVISAGVTLGADPKLRNNFRPGQQISMYNNLGGDINNVRQSLHTNAFALGAFITVGVSLF